MIQDCKYMLPCGRCDKFNYDKLCDVLLNEANKRDRDEKDKVECCHNWEESTSIIRQNKNVKYTMYICSICGDVKAEKQELKT